MNVRIKFFLVMAFFVATVPGLMIGYAWYLGMFSGVIRSEAVPPNLRLLVKPVSGEYYKASAHVSEAIRMASGANCVPAFLLLDDEQLVPPKKRRSESGCAIADPAYPITSGSGFRAVSYPDVRGGIFYKYGIQAHPVLALKKVMNRIDRDFDGKRNSLYFPILVLNYPDRRMEFWVRSWASP